MLPVACFTLVTFCFSLSFFGGGGWLGWTDQLLDAGCNVIALSRNGAPEKAESWTKGVKWVEGNALVSKGA